MMRIIISYFTGKAAWEKKQYYMIPVCVLFVFYCLFSNIIMTPSSALIAYQNIFGGLEIAFLLAFLGAVLYASIKLAKQNEKKSVKIFAFIVVPMSVLCRIARVIYLRMSIDNVVNQIGVDTEHYLATAEKSMVIANALSSFIQLMGISVLICLWVTLKNMHAGEQGEDSVDLCL